MSVEQITEDNPVRADELARPNPRPSDKGAISEGADA